MEHKPKQHLSLERRAGITERGNRLSRRLVAALNDEIALMRRAGDLEPLALLVGVLLLIHALEDTSTRLGAPPPNSLRSFFLMKDLVLQELGVDVDDVEPG
jgi:hypothetical protein